MKRFLLRFFILALTLFPAVTALAEEARKVRLVYVEWDCAIASTHLVKAVLEDRLGYDVEIMAVSAPIMWVSLKTGDADAMVSAWLPGTHRDMYAAVADGVEIIGTIVEGARLGLAVPDYVPIDSMEELSENAQKFGNKIIGIDPGAGLMGLTRQLLEDYSISNMELMQGSSALMTTRLEEAIRNREWLVVTAWSPHWMFGRWNLHYLDDPKNSLGEAEHIATAVRRGFGDEHPEAYALLSRFHFEDARQMERYMSWNQKDNTPEENARRFMRDNPELIEKWLGN